MRRHAQSPGSGPLTFNRLHTPRTHIPPPPPPPGRELDPNLRLSSYQPISIHVTGRRLQDSPNRSSRSRRYFGHRNRFSNPVLKVNINPPSHSQLCGRQFTGGGRKLDVTRTVRHDGCRHRWGQSRDPKSAPISCPAARVCRDSLILY